MKRNLFKRKLINPARHKLSYINKQLIGVLSLILLFSNIAFSQNITTGPIATTKLYLSPSSGAQVLVPYSVGVLTFNVTNGFKAYLSDANGNFTTDETNIGELANTTTDGIITANIPAATATGTGYRIRVKSTDPALTGTDNGADLSIMAIPDIVITEIMYNSYLGGADPLEYVEIYNNGTSTVDLEGFMFADAFTYVFPAGTTLVPGAYLVIGEDAVELNNKFGVTALEWSGALNNTGESIKLYTPNMQLVDEANYTNTFADGDGYSLTIPNMTTDNSVAGNWINSGTVLMVETSQVVIATPGRSEATPPVYQSAALAMDGESIDLTFDKAMADPALFKAAFTVTVDGTPATITSASLPSASVIKLNLANPITGGAVAVYYEKSAAPLTEKGFVHASDGGWLASFTETSLNTPPITTGPIATTKLYLSPSSGAQVLVPYSVGVLTFNVTNGFKAYLSDANGNFTTDETNIGELANTTTDGIITANIPAATATGTGYRIRVKSTDPALTGTDNGADLSIMAIPDIVITEIMYNSYLGGADPLEYVEIYNNGTSTVDLEGFMFADAFTYVFPAGTTLVPGAYLVIGEDAVELNNKFGVTALEWSGALNNTGESIKLYTPNMQLVDEANYTNTFADGDGYSLTIPNMTTDNSVAGNWINSGTVLMVETSQVVIATPGRSEATPPVYQSAALAMDGESIDLTFDKAMADPALFKAAFTVTVDGTPATITSASLPSASVIKLNLANPITGGAVAVYYEKSAAPLTEKGFVHASDGGWLASFTETSLNTPPSTADNTVNTTEDVAYTFGSGDFAFTDGNAGDILSAVKITNLPSNGSLFVDANMSGTMDAGEEVTLDQSIVTADLNNLKFLPALNESGAPYTTFSFKVSDGSLLSAASVMTINVTATNDPPTVVNDNYTVNEDEQLFVYIQNGLLVNDSDVDNDQTDLQVVTPTGTPSNGVLGGALIDGSFNYQPNPDFYGTDQFTYTVTDGDATSTTATVTITVTPVNDAPVASDNVYAVDEDNTLSVGIANGLLTNDTDIDNSSDELSAQLVQNVTNGSLALNSDGSFTYTPSENFYGDDVFTYEVNDNQASDNISNTATVSITIHPVNDPPTAEDDGYTGYEDTPLVINAPGILSNDTDVDGDDITAHLNIDIPVGNLTLNNDGSLEYIPAENDYGTYEFTYIAKDDDVAPHSIPATVRLTIYAVNDAPVGMNKNYNIDEDNVLKVDRTSGLLSGASDIEGNPMFIKQLSSVENGTLKVNADGSFEYTPKANYFGTEIFTFQIDDKQSQYNLSEEYTATIVVNPVNDLPKALPDRYEILEDQSFSPDVLANDSDPDEETLTIVGISRQPNYGTVTIEPDGSLTYTPNANYNGGDSFGYKITDGTNTATANAMILIEPVNDAPIGTNDFYSTKEDISMRIAAPGVLVNDTEIEGENMTVEVKTPPAHGTVQMRVDGKFEYFPAQNFYGDDSFTYTISDGWLESSPVTVTVSVLPVNDAPVTQDDSYELYQGNSLQITDPASGVIGNDSDVENDGLTAELKDDVSNGTLTLNSDGTFDYTPNAGFYGSDKFSYMVTDGKKYSDLSFANITVKMNTPSIVRQPLSFRGCVDGEITFSFEAAGEPPLTYKWYKDGAELSETATPELTVTNITTEDAGSYYCMVSNANGSVTTKNVQLMVSPMTVAAETKNVSCYGGSNGAITVDVEGGVGLPIYTLNNQTTQKNNNVFHSLTKGTYSVLVTDANGCTASVDDIEITGPASPLTLDAQTIEPICKGSEGEIMYTIDGGTKPYEFLWSSKENTVEILTINHDEPGTYDLTSKYGLYAGDYSLAVTDANGCTVTQKTMLNDPPAMQVKVAQVVDEECYNQNQGSFVVKATGGVPDYTYSIEGVENNNGEFTNLNSGKYHVTITDAMGCSDELDVTIQAETRTTADFDYVVSKNVVSFINLSNGYYRSYWTFGDNEETYDKNPMHVYNEVGTYEVSLTAISECAEVNTTKTIEIVALSLEDAKTEYAVKVYPNPSNGIFELQYSGNENLNDVKVRLLDITGKVLKTDKFSVNGKEFRRNYNVSELKSGLYLIQIDTDEKVQILRIEITN